MSLLLLAGNAIARPDALGPSSEILCAELIEVSGYRHHLRQVPHFLEIGFARTWGRSNRGTCLKRQPERLWLQFFALPVLERTMTSSLRENLSATEMETAIAWYGSSLGRKVVAQEKSASTPVALRAVEALSPQAMEMLASTERSAILARLSSSLQVTGPEGQILYPTPVAINLTLVRFFQGIDLEAGRRNASHLTPPATADPVAANPVYRAWMAYGYRNLSDLEMANYLQFADSRTGLRVRRSLAKACMEALLEASDLFRSSLAEPGGK